MITRSQSDIVKPIDRLSLNTFLISPIPKNPFDALKYPQWRNAMYDEYNALVKMALGYLYQGSPVVKPATIRTVLSLDVSHKLPIHQLDVKNAFLNDDLSETVYMHQPSGFVDASRCDSSLFIYRHGSQVAYLLIYVDDIILTASSLALLQQIIDSLHNEFDMTDLGALNYFLGISADRNSTGLFLSQSKYALQLLERTHMVHCNPSRTPVDTESKLGPEGVPVCLYMHDPRKPHFAALKRILRYVRGTVDFGLHLYASATTSLVGYTDVDWAAKRQHTLSRSSAEVEYRGVANVVAKTAWLHNLLRKLHSPLSTATLVYCNNVRVLHVPSRYQYADIFTKGVPSALFEEFWSSLSVHPPSTPIAGPLERNDADLKRNLMENEENLDQV
ncbi:ribonuclease H-like domain-containing protein [Tanacetum coccineum]